jgi:hypothetical protein
MHGVYSVVSLALNKATFCNVPGTRLRINLPLISMDAEAPKYRLEFLKSPHHVVFALATLGVGFLSAHTLPLVISGALYVLGWISIPDMPFFRHWVDRRRDALRHTLEEQKVAQFVLRRDSLLRSLTPENRDKYNRLVLVCRDIETAGVDGSLDSANASIDPRLRRLDELMWTYLRLLSIEASLEHFLEGERREKLPEMVSAAEGEINDLKAEIQDLTANGNIPLLEIKQRFLSSRLDRLDVLRKRRQRHEQAEANLALVVSEQERLSQQIKLLRADAVATKNAEALTARIDATVENLDQTNKWLSELDEFKDMVGDMPSTELRVGYTLSPPAPPPVIAEALSRKRDRMRQRQTR